MNFTRWMQDHRRSILFLLSVAVLGGLIATWTLPVSLFPYVDFPRVVVSLDAGDRAAERMMIEVTFPVEQVIRAVPGVRDLRSTTSRGSAEISVNFDWSQDMVAAMLQVQSAINQVLSSLPQGTTFNVRRMQEDEANPAEQQVGRGLPALPAMPSTGRADDFKWPARGDITTDGANLASPRKR